MKRPITVEVAGQRFTLRTDADTDYVERLARTVTERLEEARKGSRQVNTQALAILAAMHLADELAKSRAELAAFKATVRERGRKLLALLEKGAA